MKKDKKTFYLVLAGVVILVIWLMRKGTTNVVNQTGGAQTVNIPAFNLPPKGDIIIPPMPGFPPIDVTFPPVTIPGLPSDTFLSTNYNMRSACACGGGSVPYYITQQAPPPPPASAPMPVVMQPVVSSSYYTPVGDYSSMWDMSYGGSNYYNLGY